MFSRLNSLFAPVLLTLFILNPPAPQTDTHDIQVHNHSSVIIERLYMSASDKTGWGEDRLGSGVLEPRHFLPIADVPEGTYDFLFIDVNERKCTWMAAKITFDRELEIDDEWLATHCKRG